jgi:hypothetical protein
MTASATPLADPIASLRTALEADARAASARRDGALWALLALLLRLLGRLEWLSRQAPAFPLAPAPELRPEPVYTGDRPLHVLCVELGLLPSWLLRCFPGTGMRPAPVPRPRPTRRRPPPRAPSIPIPA